MDRSDKPKSGHSVFLRREKRTASGAPIQASLSDLERKILEDPEEGKRLEEYASAQSEKLNLIALRGTESLSIQDVARLRKGYEALGNVVKEIRRRIRTYIEKKN